ESFISPSDSALNVMMMVFVALETLKSDLGAPSAVVYNAASLSISRPPKNLVDMSIEDMDQHMRMNLISGFAVVQWGVKNVVPDPEGRSTVFITGGGLSLQPWAGWSGLAIGKAALIHLAKAFRVEVPGEYI
ncbi:hypothetical protein MPER_13753, partial [Moniliophthora perniciosa FA553]